MRDIKFRGIDVETKEFVYGYYWENGENDFIITIDDNDSDDIWNHTLNEVIEGTVGQFTGLQDKNGKDIYDGDIIHIDKVIDGNEHLMSDYAVIEWNKEDWKYYAICHKKDNISITDFKGLSKSAVKEFSLIGNIHQNPELLERKEK